MHLASKKFKFKPCKLPDVVSCRPPDWWVLKEEARCHCPRAVGGEAACLLMPRVNSTIPLRAIATPMFWIKETQSSFIDSHSGLLHVAVQACCWLRPACMKLVAPFLPDDLQDIYWKLAIEPLDDGSGSIVLLLSWCLTILKFTVRPFLDSMDFFSLILQFLFLVSCCKFIVFQTNALLLGVSLICFLSRHMTTVAVLWQTAHVLAEMFAWARGLVARVLVGMLPNALFAWTYNLRTYQPYYFSKIIKKNLSNKSA